MAAHPIVVQSRRAVIGGLAAGKSKSQVARKTGRSRKTVRVWQQRYAEHAEDWLTGQWYPRPEDPVMPNQTSLEIELATSRRSPGVVGYSLRRSSVG